MKGNYFFVDVKYKDLKKVDFELISAKVSYFNNRNKSLYFVSKENNGILRFVLMDLENKNRRSSSG